MEQIKERNNVKIIVKMNANIFNFLPKLQKCNNYISFFIKFILNAKCFLIKFKISIFAYKIFNYEI